MARLEDKIAEIADPSVRQAIAEEVAKLKKRTRFGLVFEEHQPEVVPIHDARIKRGERVALRTGSLTDIWRVLSIRDGQAHCEKERGNGGDAPIRETFDERQLIVVRRMGEAIYPALTPLDAVKNGDPAQQHHILIEADNYHALQLLLFPYEGKVDCIYIDPPYNTGARDWKYNNDYVDGNDSWRHSKWLAMMQRRLLMAKRLLNPADSVLIVTIDEKEYLHLGLLLEQSFPEAQMRMISTEISRKGSARSDDFARVDEYIFILFFGSASVGQLFIDGISVAPEGGRKEKVKVQWESMLRRGTGSMRTDSHLKFYPVLVDPKSKKVVGRGEILPLGQHPSDYTTPPGLIAVWPMRSNGAEGRWQLNTASFSKQLSNGNIKTGRFKRDGTSAVLYLPSGLRDAINAGKIVPSGTDSNGGPEYEWIDPDTVTGRPKTQWHAKSHNASEYGTALLKTMLPDRRFPFPKSLYAVEDALRLFVANNTEAIVLDFFAGSGTTAQAVMRLNHQDGGNRQCISVTNNEVAAEDQAVLREQGLQPGHPDWEKWGICNHITYPRLAAAITGKTPGGEPIKGDYKFIDEFPMADGFATNLEYFRLDFLEPGEVQMGRQFAAILPILWMMAGARGPRPEPPDAHAPWLLPAGCPFAVLMQETRFKDFLRHVEARIDLTHIFVVTNSTDTVYKLRQEWPERRVVQLYKDYLENFRINLTETPAP